jgi:hypothetical protein
MTNKSLKKIFLLSGGALIAILIILILFISPIAKYMLERYDKDLIGRELKMDWAYVNPLTGYVYLKNPVVYEEQGDSTFLSVKSVHATINLIKLFTRTVEINNFTFNQPKGRVLQNKNVFSIDDIIRKFTPDSTETNSSGWGADISSLKINNGEFHYLDKIIPINYFIKNVTIETVGKLNAGDTISAKFSFLAGIRTGKLKGTFTINTKSNDYRFAVNVHDLDLEIIRQYIWELINYGMFTAHMDADIKAHGNFNSKDSISATGRLTIRDFHLGKTVTDDYAACKKLRLVVDQLSPYKHKYLIDTILIDKSYFKYEQYDSLDNIQTLFGKAGKNISDVTQQPGRFNLVIEIARYVKIITRNFFRSDYKIRRLEIRNANLRYNDFSLSNKFSIGVHPLSITADSINRSDQRVHVYFKSGIEPYGHGTLQLSINPKDSGDFDMRYRFEKIPATVFNPYLLTHTSFPLDRGILELNGSWRVRNGSIKSDNHLILIDPRMSKRLRNKDMKWIPMPLIMAFVRERGNVIDYKIPITGNLNNPRFHLRDVLTDVVENIFIKPPTTPYRFDVKNLENKIEKSLHVTWEMHQYKLLENQETFLKEVSGFLKNNPQATISVYPMVYSEKEKEYILFYETKKKYYLKQHHINQKSFSKKDSITVEKMSVKNPTLVRALSKGLSDTVMFTLQEKCYNYVGHKTVNKKLNELKERRKNTFLSFFIKDGTDKQIKIHRSVSEIPFNGFSYFKLDYQHDIPVALRDAYQKMTELNDKVPRKKYKKYRRKEDKLTRI